QAVPFERIVQEVQPARDLSRHPLFQVLINSLNLEGVEIKLDKLKIDQMPIGGAESKFDMTLYVRETSSIELVLVFNRDLFSSETATELLDQLVVLLEQIVADPQRKAGSFTLVTALARPRLPDPYRKLDAEWVGPIGARLSEWASRTPSRLAVSDAVEQLSYHDLEVTTNQLAHRLVEAGVQRGEFVAVLGRRSAALTWAVLGILKAGAAVLLLDPAYPTERLIRSLGTVTVRGWIGLTRPCEAVSARVRGLELRVRIALDDGPVTAQLPWLEDYAALPPSVTIEPDDAAYVILTSGTTGEPNGVATPHRALSHFLSWQSRIFDLQPSERFALLAGLSHDPVWRDLLAPVWSGAQLCVPDASLQDGPAVGSWINGQAITVIHATPQLARLLVASEEVAPKLRWVFLAGDRVDSSDISGLARWAPEARTVNFYGASETPQAMAHALATAADPIVAIGPGIEGAQLILMNSHGVCCGRKEVGEIHVRTPYLSWGYIGRADLTAERFVPSPFGEGERLYRT
ncbi:MULTISPECIES: AMP-binding protein, partial [unclassified Bradyrhizobium]